MNSKQLKTTFETHRLILREMVQTDYPAMACKEYVFDKLGFKEVFSIVRSSNIASKDVAIRIGMIIRKRIVRNYRGIDMPHFVLSATNPPQLMSAAGFTEVQRVWNKGNTAIIVGQKPL